MRRVGLLVLIVVGLAWPLLVPRYFDDFQGFASRCLDSNAKIQLTDRGRLVCKGQEPLLLIEAGRGILRADLLVKSLRLFRLFGAVGQHQSMDAMNV